MRLGHKPGWGRTRFWELACLSLLGGLLLARGGIAIDERLLVAAGVCLALTIKIRRLLSLGIAVMLFSLGIWRGQLVLESFKPLFARFDRAISIEGQVSDDAIIGDRYQTEFHINHLRVQDGGATIPSGGRLLVRGFAPNKINRGDSVLVKGKLRPALGNNQGQISFGEITILARRVSPIESLRRRFFAAVHTTMAEPGGSLGLGFLVGGRGQLPDDLEAELALTGLTHMVAVSGYNLTIIVRAVRRRLGGYSKYLATATSVALIGGFLLVTGSSPSIFRAAVVSGLALMAWYYGRPLKAGVLLLLAAAITAAVSPSYLWYDIGWYLSFLAFFGVLVVAPRLLARFNQPVKGWRRLLAESLSAQIMTLPLIIFIFGRASVVALPANLIIMPVVPLAMLLTLLAGLGGWLLPALGGWMGWPANWLLANMVKVVQGLVSISPPTSLKLNSWEMLIGYTAILVAVLILIRSLKSFRTADYSIVE